MAIEPRKIICDIANCGALAIEAKYGDGFIGWIGLKGIANEKGEEPWICPECTKKLMKILNGGEE
jgi:hypothetical protein